MAIEVVPAGLKIVEDVLTGGKDVETLSDDWGSTDVEPKGQRFIETLPVGWMPVEMVFDGRIIIFELLEGCQLTLDDEEV